MPACQDAIVDLVEAGVPGTVVPEQDVRGTVAIEVANPLDRIGSGRTADPVPPLEAAVGIQLIETGIPCGIVAEQHVRGGVAVEVAYPDNSVSGGRTADRVPALQCAVADLVESC